MKTVRLSAAFLFLAAITITSISAQTRSGSPPASQPAASSAAVVPDSKIAWISSADFQDPKTGIARISATMSALDREFQPRQTELTQLQQRYQQLNDEVEKTKNVQDPKITAQKMDQLEQLKIDITRKQEDGQKALENRQKELFGPLEQDIGVALQEYAKAHGISVLIDRSRVPLVYADDRLDITKAFIADYNSKKPATASAATPR